MNTLRLIVGAVSFAAIGFFLPLAGGTAESGRDRHALAVWDFDGTILKGDCSEGLGENGVSVYLGLIADCIRAGFAANYRGDEGVARFWREYEAKIAAGRKYEAYEDVARIFAGADVERIEAFARKRFDETMKPHLFAYSLDRFRELESAGVENHVVSASPEFFVQAAAETLGVPRSRVHGIRMGVEGGRLVNRIDEPFPYGDGKTEWVRKLEKESGRKALYGFGNSYGTDGPFLKAIAQQGGTSVMINGGKVVPGMTELFICTNLFATISNFKEKTAMKKTLVVYFSATGTTKAKAEVLAKVLGADIKEIVPAQRYTAADLNWHDSKSRSSVEMDDKSSRPEIAGKIDNIADYDTVYLGFPIWWGIAPTIVNTFLEAHDFAGKRIIPFFTSGGSGAGRTLDYLKPSAPKATFVQPKNLTGASEVAIRDWVEQ